MPPFRKIQRIIQMHRDISQLSAIRAHQDSTQNHARSVQPRTTHIYPSLTQPSQVTDKKPIGQTTYKLTLTNQPTGLDSLVNAKPPIGALNINSKWRVVEGNLVEEADIDGNMITKKMGKDTVTKEHPKAMVKILAAAAKA